MRITQLSIENFKRLSAVEITPDGAIIPITGRNGNGKSSVLDAIASAMGGASLCPTDPIKHGEETAEVEVDLGDLVVTRRWRRDKHGALKTDIRVTTPEGARHTNPQQVLDTLYGKLSFDPLDFSRMRPKEQFEQLKDCAGLDFTADDKEHQTHFDERRMAKRQLKEAESRLAGMTRPEVDSFAERDVPAIVERLQDAHGKRALHESDLAQRAVLQRDLDTAKEAVEAITKTLQILDETIEDYTDPPIDAIKHELETAQKVADDIRIQAAYDETDELVQRIRGRVETSDEAIVAIRKRRTAAIREAAFPVDGLSIDPDLECVMLGDVPFDQASSAEQLRASIAIGLALNPTLRVMLVRDGSLLDEDSLAMLADMAGEADAQVFLERVTNGEPVGIVIEDGMVADTVAAPE